MNTEDWLRIKARLTQEDLDWLWKFFSNQNRAKSKIASKEDFRNQFWETIKSSKLGHFTNTKENTLLVTKVLEKLNVDFNDEDLKPDQ